MEFLLELQRSIQATLSGELRAFANDGNWAALLAVLPAAVLFGAVHALTPGHGKTLLASYLTGAPGGVLRGLAVAGALAATHILTAVLVALVALPLASRALGSVGEVPALELLSRALLVLVGIWLVVRACRPVAAHRHAGEAPLVGIVAGLVPCPLTLLAMTYAVSKGVPAAGLVFAAALLLGVFLTLAAVAALAVLARQRLLLPLLARGPWLDRGRRVAEGLAGALLLALAGFALLA